MTDDTRSRQELLDELNALRRENEKLKQAFSETEQSISKGSAPPPGSETILIVDDNEHTRSIVADMVEELGYSPLVAATSGDAIDWFMNTEKKIDLIISDIVMPEGDGPDMIAKILKIKPDIKVIFMSGYAEDEIVHDSVYKIQGSSAAFMKKPFTLAELKSLLHKQMTE